MLDFPDCLAEGKVWDGLDVQTFNWNLVDARESDAGGANFNRYV